MKNLHQIAFPRYWKDHRVFISVEPYYSPCSDYYDYKQFYKDVADFIKNKINDHMDLFDINFNVTLTIDNAVMIERIERID